MHNTGLILSLWHRICNHIKFSLLRTNLNASMSVAVAKSQLQNCIPLTQSRNACASAVFLFLTTKGLTIITRVCRMDSENSGGVLFVLMSRIPDSVLLSAVTITRGKLPESVVIKCDASVLNDPCASLFRPVSRAKHCQDASADIHGDGSGIQGDLLRHHGAGAADRS